MPILWMIMVYFISSMLNRWLTSERLPSKGVTSVRLTSKRHPGKKQRGPVKKFLWGSIWGLTAVLVADQLSPVEPAWIALTFIFLIGGTLFSFFHFKQGNNDPSSKSEAGQFAGEDEALIDLRQLTESGLIGLGVYFGGIFYLEPLLGSVSLALTLEIFLVGKDILTGIMAFIGLIPILFQYAQLNQDFFWVALGMELVFAIHFRSELWKRFGTTFLKFPREKDEKPS